MTTEGRKVFTVTELTKVLRAEIEGAFPEVWLEGEVSNFRAPAASGHLYFTLKDAGAQVKAVMFKGSQRGGLGFALEDGLKVLAFGRLSVYEPRGEYQVIVERMEPQGLGALQMAFEQLKKKLAAEGLFETARKRRLPAYPRAVAVVTSPGGAVIHDILQVTRRRCPWVNLVLLPVRVQGEGAAVEIADAVRRANQELGGEVDVLVVARGGGSLEDLWAFNEEAVARAIFESRLPVISAVGHETDFSIADFVADHRAPTPSAAAEMLSTGRDAILGAVADFGLRLDQAMGYAIQDRFQRVAGLGQRLQQSSPKAMLEQNIQRLDELAGRMSLGARKILGASGERLGALAGHLSALSPLAILQRGYAAVFQLPARKLLKRAVDAKPGEALEVLLGQGKLQVKVERIL